MGLCSPKDKTIHIDAKLQGDEKVETMLHELFHAALYETSANQPLGHDLEEVIVDVLARVVAKNFELKKKK